VRDVKFRQGEQCRAVGTVLWLGSILLLGLAIGGCSQGSPTAPDEIDASWDNISFASPHESGRLSIDAGGRITLLEVDEGADPGWLGPATWRELENALRAADLEDSARTDSNGRASLGFVRVTRGGSSAQFEFEDPASLSPAKQCLVGILQGIWLHSFGPQPEERVEFIPVERLLHGHYARRPSAAEFVIRDEDALIDLLRESLDESHSMVVMPAVDFSSHMVVAVFLGLHDHAHVDVRVDGFATYSANGYLQISLSRYVLEEGCSTPGGRGGAFEIIALPRAGGEIYLNWDTVSVGCEGQTGW